MAAVEEKQRISILLSEYLSSEGYTKTFEAFSDELAERGEGGEIRHDSVSGPNVDELLEAFELGEREAFFELWDKLLPMEMRADDPTCTNLEFNLSLYFAVYCYRSGQDHKAEDEKKAFKHYLETRGSIVAQSEEFVAFYALPYIPDPRSHASFKCLFSDKWNSELSQRIRDFVKAYFPKQSKLPSLVELVRGERSGLHPDVATLQKKLGDMTVKNEKVTKQLKEITHSYHALVGVSTEMVSALEIAIKEKMIDPDFLTRTCSKLFQGPMMAPSADLTRPRTATSILRASINAAKYKSPPGEDVSYLPSLNVVLLKEDLQSVPDRDKAALLQALRWRLTQTQPGEQRDVVLSSYVQHDLLGMLSQDTYSANMERLLYSQDDMVNEQMARLFNSLSSLNGGRAYLAQSSRILPVLVDVLKKQDFVDNPVQINIVGTLQKLSLRRQSQSEMISLDLVSWIVQLLAEHMAALSEYTFHYALALLMNLSLRTKGRQCCACHSKALLKLLSDLLEHENEEVRSYTHGTLYSILGVMEIRMEARAMGMEAMLKSAISSSPPEMKSQLNYITEQLLSNTGGQSSEDMEYDSDGDEDDDEEDPDVIDGDEGEKLTVIGGPIGEDLLMSKYLGVMTSMASASLPAVKNLKESSRSAPLSRPVTPQSHPSRPAHPQPVPVAPVTQTDGGQRTMEAFVSRPKIPRTPEGLPPPPTPSESPPTIIQRSRPHTRSGQTITLQK